MAMTGFRPAIALIVGFLALLLGGAAQAQEDLSAGKSPEQLFQLDCAICHKSPQGLSKAGGLFGLDGFLAQHYTASGATASAIAGYLKAVDSAAASAPHRRSRHPRRDAAKPRKPAAAKSDTTKKSDTAKKSDKMKSDAAAKATDEKSAKPAADKPKADTPKMAEPKPGPKKPAPRSEAKRDKPKPAEKKTD